MDAPPSKRQCQSSFPRFLRAGHSVDGCARPPATLVERTVHAAAHSRTGNLISRIASRSTADSPALLFSWGKNAPIFSSVTSFVPLGIRGTAGDLSGQRQPICELHDRTPSAGLSAIISTAARAERNTLGPTDSTPPRQRRSSRAGYGNTSTRAVHHTPGTASRIPRPLGIP
jgi:hypothetical protein